VTSKNCASRDGQLYKHTRDLCELRIRCRILRISILSRAPRLIPNCTSDLSIGCDHNGIFFLIGSLAEIRLYRTHLPTQQRIMLEASLAQQYGLTYSATRDVPGSSKVVGRFTCAPLRASRTSDDAL